MAVTWAPVGLLHVRKGQLPVMRMPLAATRVGNRPVNSRAVRVVRVAKVDRAAVAMRAIKNEHRMQPMMNDTAQAPGCREGRLVGGVVEHFVHF